MAPQANFVTHDREQLAMRADVLPDSLDTGARTVDVTWTTGARVRRHGLFGPGYYEELSLDPDHVRMDALNEGAPLLDAHSRSSGTDVIGRVVSASLEAARGVATVRFPVEGASDRADTIFRLVADGILSKISVGYAVHRAERVGDVEEDDEKIPIYRAIDWEPLELSFVPIPADAGASVRSAPVEKNPCVFVDAIRGAAMTDPTPVVTEEKPPVAKPDSVFDIAKERLAAKREERERTLTIRRIGDQMNLDADVIDEHLSGDTTVDAFRAIAIDARAEAEVTVGGRPGAVESVPGGDSSDKWVRGVSDWLLIRSGIDGQVQKAAKMRGDTERLDAGEFGGMSYVALAREALSRAGVSHRGMMPMDIIGKALTIRAGEQTTGEFPLALENTMHKALLASYSITADAWTRFCAIGSVSDFRAHNRYRIGALGELQTVAEAGEYKNQQVADAEKEQISATTKGSIVALTRQALINDDMSVFSRMAGMLGRGAARTIEKDVFALLALNSGLGPAMSDGDTLFHANHGNIGAGVALTVAGIDADRILMATQMDPNSNDFLDLRPSVILVAIGLGSAARILNEAQYDPDVTNKFQKPNSVVGMFNDVVDTPRITGTRRYLFADPSIAPTLEVVFLNGQRAPHLETKDGWRVDGVEWKIRLDFGVGAVDFRGAVTDAGV